ncbi:MAG: hypothetical protein ACFBSD_01130 [Paracoccaceae bacterium]
MDRNFAYQDFLLVAAPPETVLPALLEIARRQAIPPTPSAEADAAIRMMQEMGESLGDERRSLGRQLWTMARIFVGVKLLYWRVRLQQVLGLRKPPPPPDPEEASGLSLHVDDAAEPERPITWSADATHAPFAMRLSGLAARPGWTLVECAEMVSGWSPTAGELSDALPGTEVHFFRRSGSETPETQHDYHLYCDGVQARRVLAHLTVPEAPEGETPAEPWWEGIAEGPVQSHEDARHYMTATEAETITAETQAAMLDRLGLPPSMLWAEGGRVQSVLISTRPGGAPIEEVGALLRG